MHVSTSGSEPANAELKLGDQTIEWTDTYRYLGYDLHRTLRNGDFWSKLTGRIHHVVGQFVLRHNVARHLSVASQLQVLNTHVLGSVTYLLPIIPLCEETQRKSIDSAIRKALRKVLGAHTSCSILSIHADSRVMPIDALIMQHRLRFKLDLETTPSQRSPAVQVFRALELEPRPGSRRTTGNGRGLDALGSWLDFVASDERRFKALTGLDVPAPPVAAKLDVHAYSVGVARMFAYASIRQGMDKRVPGDCTATVIASTDFLQTSQHAKKGYTGRYQAGLHYAGPDDWDTARRSARMLHLLTANAAVTRISAWAAGCDGSPIALSTRLSARQCRVIQYFRLGRDALTFWPFNQRAAQVESGSDAARWSRHHKSARGLFHIDDANCECPFDGCAEPQHHPIHFATTCKSPVWAGYQAFLRSGVRKLLERMLFMLGKAYGEHPPASFKAAREALRAQLGAAHAATWSSLDYTHAVMRLLSCAPFSVYDLRSQVPLPGNTTTRALRASTAAQRPPAPIAAADMPLSRALGQLFDSVQMQRSYLRQWANLWCQWAFKYIMALAGHYNCSRGFDRDDVPCHAHRNQRCADHHSRLHEVTDLARDAGAVDDDDDDETDASSAVSDADTD